MQFNTVCIGVNIRLDNKGFCATHLIGVVLMAEENAFMKLIIYFHERNIYTEKKQFFHFFVLTGS